MIPNKSCEYYSRLDITIKDLLGNKIVEMSKVDQDMAIVLIMQMYVQMQRGVTKQARSM
jgi:hypothetical protein